MKRICLFLIAFTLLLAGCNSNKVKVRGKVIGLQGTVKLLAEMPGQQGLVILAKQDVTDGNIDLETEALQIPARVWVDVAGKNTLEFILDSKDQIWIQGKIKFPDLFIHFLFVSQVIEFIDPVDHPVQYIVYLRSKFRFPFPDSIFYPQPLHNDYCRKCSHHHNQKNFNNCLLYHTPGISP